MGDIVITYLNHVEVELVRFLESVIKDAEVQQKKWKLELAKEAASEYTIAHNIENALRHFLGQAHDINTLGGVLTRVRTEFQSARNERRRDPLAPASSPDTDKKMRELSSTLEAATGALQDAQRLLAELAGKEKNNAK